MMELIGWTGSMLMALCAFPQAYKCFQEKHSNGISWGFLMMWLIGEVLVLIYVFPTYQWPLIFNYIANIIALSVILYYKIWPTNMI